MFLSFDNHNITSLVKGGCVDVTIIKELINKRPHSNVDFVQGHDSEVKMKVTVFTRLRMFKHTPPDRQTETQRSTQHTEARTSTHIL